MDENNITPDETPQAAEPTPAASSPANEGSFKFCTRCGRRLSMDAAYCDGCGHAQGAQKVAPDISFAPRKTYAPEKISDIVGKERAYYNRKFAEINDSGSHASWNWYACLGWYWYAYRKMPVEAVICFAAYIILGAVQPFGWLLRLGVLAASGALGNYIYLKHIERTIDKIDMLPANMKSGAVKEYGGVSGLLLLIAFLLSALATGGISILGATFHMRRPLSLIRRGLRYFTGF